MTSYHFLIALLARPRRLLVNNPVIVSERKDLVTVVESSVLAVDCHERLFRKATVPKLWYTPAGLNIGCIATSARDAPDLGFGIDV